MHTNVVLKSDVSSTGAYNLAGMILILKLLVYH